MVPGYVEVKGIETADELAREGSETALTGSETILCGLGLHTVRENLWKEEEGKRAEVWEKLPRLRRVKELLGKYNLKKKEGLFKL